PARPPLFPYTTLFRSVCEPQGPDADGGKPRPFLSQRNERRVHHRDANGPGNPKDFAGVRHGSGEHGGDPMKFSGSAFGLRTRDIVRAFTLLEVMIALTIFFMAIFTILGSVSRSLGAARSLQHKFPEIDALAAELMLT